MSHCTVFLYCYRILVLYDTQKEYPKKEHSYLILKLSLNPDKSLILINRGDKKDRTILKQRSLALILVR